MADFDLTHMEPKESQDDLVSMVRRCSPCFLCGTNCLICQGDGTNPKKSQAPTSSTAVLTPDVLLEESRIGHFSFCQQPACSASSPLPGPEGSTVSIQRVYFCSEPCHLIHKGDEESKSNSSLRDSRVHSEGQKNPECSPTSSSVEKPICCRGFAIAENSTVGRFVVATKEVRPLETVLEDFPVVIAPQSQPVCLVCLRKARNLEFACLLCCFPMCSKECVPLHQDLPECAVFSQKPGSGPRCEEDLNQSSIAYASVGVIRLLDFIAETNSEHGKNNKSNNNNNNNPTHRVT